MGPEIKNQISHRSRALGKFREKLLALIDKEARSRKES
ncbi:MAG: hypothetical protein ACUZ8A_07325 [Candidatus Bathyanammoxibius sp.]